MVTAFSSKLFGCSVRLKLVTCEISTLGRNNPAVWNKIGSDQGFEMISEQTGERAAWVVDQLDVVDGEIQGWKMKPTQATITKLPQLHGFRMLVVNT